MLQLQQRALWSGDSPAERGPRGAKGRGFCISRRPVKGGKLPPGEAVTTATGLSYESSAAHSPGSWGLRCSFLNEGSGWQNTALLALNTWR